MKLTIPYKKVSEIPLKIIDDIVSSFVEEDWHTSDYRKKADNMESTNSIPIFHTEKCINSDPYSNDAIRSIRKYPLYDKYYPLIDPILQHLKSIYEYRQYAAFFARLAPRSVVGSHVDGNKPFLASCHRIHVPIVTNSEVSYVIEGMEYYWKKGSVYEFDNMREHGVINRSDQYRIHLVINLYNLTNEELNN